jgi:hypothetical protein
LITSKPLEALVTVTAAPLAARITIGAEDVPELAGRTFSVYVPVWTDTVSPAIARNAPWLIVHKGVADEPGPESEHSGFARSTSSVAAREPRAPANNMPLRTSTIGHRRFVTLLT